MPDGVPCCKQLRFRAALSKPKERWLNRIVMRLLIVRCPALWLVEATRNTKHETRETNNPSSTQGTRRAAFQFLLPQSRPRDTCGFQTCHLLALNSPAVLGRICAAGQAKTAREL